MSFGGGCASKNPLKLGLDRATFCRTNNHWSDPRPNVTNGGSILPWVSIFDSSDFSLRQLAFHVLTVFGGAGTTDVGWILREITNFESYRKTLVNGFSSKPLHVFDTANKNLNVFAKLDKARLL